MAQKVIATMTTLIGAVGTIYSLLGAFGIELTQDQQTAVTGFGALLVTLAGLWLHPSVPIGSTEEKPKEGETNITSVNPTPGDPQTK